MLAGIFRADVFNNLDFSRDDIKLFGYLFTDAFFDASALTDLLCIFEIVNDFNYRQVVRDGASTPFFPFMGRDINLLILFKLITDGEFFFRYVKKAELNLVWIDRFLFAFTPKKLVLEIL